MRHKCVMIVAASVLLPISHVRSAPINWGTPADTTGKADLIEGAVVLAVSSHSYVQNLRPGPFLVAVLWLSTALLVSSSSGQFPFFWLFSSLGRGCAIS